MQLGFASIIISLLLAHCANGAAMGPVSASTKILGNTKGLAVGAAYFTTNHPDGNFIVAAEIGTDGELTLTRAVDAGGLGAHGLVDPITPEALFSQGCVKASSKANILATVNAGSNTLSAFKIDPNDPTDLRMIGKPISSGGEFPVSVAFNKAGDMLCAVNAGAINGVSCYSIDKQRGLMPLPNTVRSLGLNQTTPATGPTGTAGQIIFTEDEKQLMVAVKGTPPQQGFFAAWDVLDRSLSRNYKRISLAQGVLLPFSMTVIPNKNAILAADAGLGFDIVDLADAGSRSRSNRSSATKIEGQAATCWSAYSASTGNFYFTDAVTSMITEINIDDNLKPTIVKQYPQDPTSVTIDFDIASVADKDFIYVLAANATAVYTVSLDGPGQTTNIQKLDISGPACRADLTIDANNLQGMTVYIRGQDNCYPSL